MQKRKEVENKIYKTFDLMDPSGINSSKYKKLFSKMNDKQFLDYFKSMKNDYNRNFYMEVDLYGKNNVTLSAIEKAANFLKLPLEEKIYIKHKSSDGSIIESRFKVPVMYLHLKRLQQILSKKMRLSTETTGAGVRSRLTGVVNSTHSTGRVSDGDTVALISVADLGNESILNNPNIKDDGLAKSAILSELLGARADDMSRKLDMGRDISLFGNTRQSHFSKDNSIVPKANQAINTLDVFLLGAMMKSDVVTPDLHLRQFHVQKTRE